MKFEAGLVADFYGVDCKSFKLNNCVFEAIEDDEDGYRSCMTDILVKDDTKGLIFFETPLARVCVDEVTNEHFEGYELADIKDGYVWLRLGTDDIDDYYPLFVFFYQHKHEYVLKQFES